MGSKIMTNELGKKEPLEDIVRKTIEKFCFDFLSSPFQCYTEHGIHAMFYQELMNRIPKDRQVINVNGKDISIVQKEYCMRDKSGKKNRANWDIAILSEKQTGKPDRDLRWYDCLKLNSVVEFGLNPGEHNHVEDDIQRLSHIESGVEHGFVVHLYRLSNDVTRKDWGKRWSKRIWTSIPLTTFNSEKQINKMIQDNGNRVIGYWALYDDIRKEVQSTYRIGPYRMDGKSLPQLLTKEEISYQS
jgi:hypothetical protein